MNKTQSILDFFNVPSITSEVGSKKYVSDIIESMLERFIGEPYISATFDRAIGELLNELREREITVFQYDFKKQIVNGAVITIIIHNNSWANLQQEFQYALMNSYTNTIESVEDIMNSDTGKIFEFFGVSPSREEENKIIKDIIHECCAYQSTVNRNFFINDKVYKEKICKDAGYLIRKKLEDAQKDNRISKDIEWVVANDANDDRPFPFDMIVVASGGYTTIRRFSCRIFAGIGSFSISNDVVMT